VAICLRKGLVKRRRFRELILQNAEHSLNGNTRNTISEARGERKKREREWRATMERGKEEEGEFQTEVPIAWP